MKTPTVKSRRSFLRKLHMRKRQNRCKGTHRHKEQISAKVAHRRKGQSGAKCANCTNVSRRKLCKVEIASHYVQIGARRKVTGRRICPPAPWPRQALLWQTRRDSPPCTPPA